jgi:DUF1680 family protein
VSAAPNGPVLPVRRSSLSVLRPASGGRVEDGVWGARRATNRDVSVPDGWERLDAAGNLRDLRLAAGTAAGEYAGDLPFMDSDVGKWLEAVGWLLSGADTGSAEREQLEKLADEAVRLLAEAQTDDGYLNSYVQVVRPGERWQHLDWGHELYCAGHLIQAGIALFRGTGRTDLLGISRRLADCIDEAFGTGPGRVDGVDGHPEIEMALVELYRVTGERRYLSLATYFVDRRGRGLLGPAALWGFDFGSGYWQDDVPVREATAAQGHAVRQLYLLAGAVDVAVENADTQLVAAVEQVWADMLGGKTYLTGGVGAHHLDEAFGDPYELPSEQAYAETCASIASVMLCWRLLLATGRARYADLIERTLYNGVLPGVSLSGDTYLYVNPLQVRDSAATEVGGDRSPVRSPWFRCACCPPNLMRLLASLEYYVVTVAHRTIAVTQYVSGTYDVSTTRGDVRLAVDSGLPWHGTVRITLERAPDPVQGPWTLVLRDPQWSAPSDVRVRNRRVDRLRSDLDPDTGEIPLAEGDRQVGLERRDGWIRLHRRWRTGDVVELKLNMDVRTVRADPRVDAVRGCVALERGPLVYCLEGVDHPGLRLDDLVVDPAQPPVEFGLPGVLDGMVLLRCTGRERSRALGGWWPYRSSGGVGEGGPDDTLGEQPADTTGEQSADTTGERPADTLGEQPDGHHDDRRIDLVAIPYFAWGNRAPGPMRVWIPTD